MAATSYGVNDPLAVKLWSKRLSVEVLKNTWIGRFMGDSSSDVIQIKDETQKSAGDKITYGLRMQLTGAGVIGDGTLEGQEEALTTYNDSVLINQLRHAVRSAGRMSQQRVPFSIRDEALSGLRDWWSDRIDFSGFNQLCGFTPTNTPAGALGAADTRWTGLQAVTAPDSNHIIRSDASAVGDDSITTTATFSLSMIDKAVERARVATPAIRPVTVGGKPFYPVFIHPYQVTDLRTNTSTGQWLDIQKAAMTGGEVQDNPIFDGSLGVYNGAILHSDYRVTPGVNQSNALTQVSNVRRAVFVGAQAAMCAYGRDNGPERYTWVEELFDYENELGVSAGLIWGLKKTVFNSTDFGTIVLSSYAAAH
jgi:N4-gp56 family major capsid protein